MWGKKGFDTDIFLELEENEIRKRANKFDKLYLEFGGHLCYDGHASRVLPGYRPRAKLELLQKLNDVEIIYCVSAKDLSTTKRLGDFKLDYQQQTLYDLLEFRRHKIKVCAVSITMFAKQPEAIKFKRELERKGYSVYISPEIKNYLRGPKYAVAGYAKYPHIPTESKIVIVTGAAGGSGKMATAMSQVYHELKKDNNAGYAKVETFPIWNLPLSHPVNIAYEAATADLGDVLEYDPYYLKAYKKKAVNYNRDIQNFAILRDIARIITHTKNPFGYLSPTDMGINMEKQAIIDDETCRLAALHEIERRYKVYLNEYRKGRESVQTLEYMKKIMKKSGLFAPVDI